MSLDYFPEDHVPDPNPLLPEPQYYPEEHIPDPDYEIKNDEDSYESKGTPAWLWIILIIATICITILVICPWLIFI